MVIRSDKTARLGLTRPILKFVMIFGLVMGSYYLVAATPLYRKNVFPAYLKINATVSAEILSWFGEETRSVGNSVVSPEFSVGIEQGCDAIEPATLFLAAVLAFPVAFRMKIPGILIGVPTLLLINLVRIISLYYVGIFFPSSFDMMHIEVWQPAFILLLLLFWAIWFLWVARRTRTVSNDSA
jgi:exosortase H (IPTLxxWG-CTERM-specific)